MKPPRYLNGVDFSTKPLVKTMKEVRRYARMIADPFETRFLTSETYMSLGFAEGFFRDFRRDVQVDVKSEWFAQDPARAWHALMTIRSSVYHLENMQHTPSQNLTQKGEYNRVLAGYTALLSIFRLIAVKRV